MNQRNHSIDILKFVCATLIVCLHTYSKWHDYFIPLTRCAVPCFLMISGFLLYSEKGIGRERLVRTIKHIFHIIVWSTLLFAVVTESRAIAKDGVFIPSGKDWLYCFALNENPFGYHLWYLQAYLYVLPLMLIVDKYKLWKLMLCATPLLLLGNTVLSAYGQLVFQQVFPVEYMRNFLFTGIPYFMVGVFLKMHIHKLLTVNRLLYLGGIILFSITTVMEKVMILRLEYTPDNENYISTTLLAVCLFLFVASFQNTKDSTISSIGEKDSLYIYIFHPLIILILAKLSSKMPEAFQTFYLWTAPLFVLILTTIASIALRKTKLL